MIWEADNSTGIAKYFSVEVEYVAPIFELGECEAFAGHSRIYASSESSINLRSLEPFSNYSVRVSSQNDYGKSNMSQKYFIVSKSSAPSSPRNISINFQRNNEDDSKVVGVLQWKAPCRLNGLFSLYTISLKGSRVGFDDHSSTDAASYQNFTYKNLRRGYEYEVKIQARNSESPGEISKFNFTTPSGSKKQI